MADPSGSLPSWRDHAAQTVSHRARDVRQDVISPKDASAWEIRENGARVHRTATVADDAELGSKCIVGPGTVLEAGARVGDRAVLGNSVLLESGAVVGDGAMLDDSIVRSTGRVGADAVVADSEVCADVDVAPRAVILASTLHDHSRVGEGSFVGDIHVRDHAEIGKDARVGWQGEPVGSVDVPPLRETKLPDGRSKPSEVGERAVVGDGAVVGSRVWLQHRSRVDSGAVVGHGVHLHAEARVGEGATLGRCAEIHLRSEVPPGATVDEGRQVRRVPPTGPEQDSATPSSPDRESPSSPAASAVDDPSPEPDPVGAPDPGDSGSRQPAGSARGDSSTPLDEEERQQAILEAALRAQAAARAQQQRDDAGPRPESGGDRDSEVPTYAPASSTQATVTVPQSVVEASQIPESELPRLTEVGEGVWEVHDDPYVDRVVARPDGSFDVVLHEGVRPVASVERDEGGKPRSEFRVTDAAREQAVRDLGTATREPFAAAFEAGHSSLDVPRERSDTALATNPATGERFDGRAGEMLRSQAAGLGHPGDARFATRAEIEAAGGQVREGAPGVLVERAAKLPATLSGSQTGAQAEFGVRTPEVLFHVASQTDPAPDLPSRSAPLRNNPGLTPTDLTDSLGLEPVQRIDQAHTGYQPSTQEGSQTRRTPEEFNIAGGNVQETRTELNSRFIDASVRAAVSRHESDGVRVEPPLDKDRFSSAERELVCRLAADRTAARMGAPYSPLPIPPAERPDLAAVVGDKARFERVSKEADRVSAWVVDGARDRLHERGRETSQERFQQNTANESANRSSQTRGQEQQRDDRSGPSR